MIYDIDIAKQVAKSLLQINAIILQPNNPFKWAAGWNSPIYCDNRKTLSYPEIRTNIKQGLAAIVKNHYKGANVIAGVATAGIPHGALVARVFIASSSIANIANRNNSIGNHLLFSLVNCNLFFNCCITISLLNCTNKIQKPFAFFCLS